MFPFSLHAALTLACWVGFLFLALFRVPSDAEQGVVQRIFYFHVPTAWVSFLGFILCFYHSVRYLRGRKLRSDSRAHNYALLGWIFTTGVIITGPLWARPIWGHFWNWSDQRLVSFFVLWLAFAAYLILRRNITEAHKRARFSAIWAIISFLDLPLVYFSIRIWNTPSHPGPVVGGSRATGVADPMMRVVFWTGVICFHLLFFLLARLLAKMEENRLIADNGAEGS